MAGDVNYGRGQGEAGHDTAVSNTVDRAPAGETTKDYYLAADEKVDFGWQTVNPMLRSRYNMLMADIWSIILLGIACSITGKSCYLGVTLCHHYSERVTLPRHVTHLG